MRSYLLSPAAQSDLEEIWNYTAATWSVEQAERYVLGIRDACQGPAGCRRQGRAIQDVRPGYRKLAVGSHFLFFRLADAGDDILAVTYSIIVASSGIDRGSSAAIG